MLNNLNKRISFIFLMMISLYAYHTQATGREEKVHRYDGVAITSYQIEFLYSEEGVVKAKIAAEEAFQYESGDREFKKGIYIEFFNEKKEVVTELIAKRVFYDATENIYEFTGGVTINNRAKNQVVKTEVLLWDPSKAQVSSKEQVSIKEGNTTLSGQGFTAKQDFSKYTILRPMGQVQVKRNSEEHVKKNDTV